MLNTEASSFANNGTEAAMQRKNPVERVGKIFKYDFMSYSRNLFPMCLMILAVSLVLFIFSLIPGVSIFNNIDSSDPTGVVSLIMVTLWPTFAAAVFVCLVIMVGKNIKKSYFGNEAYLRMAFPVSVGEHMCGTILSGLLWFIIVSVVCIVSFTLVFGQEIGTAYLNADSFIEFLKIVLIAFTFITFIFITEAIGSLFSKKKLLGQFLFIIGVIIICEVVEHLILATLTYAMTNVITMVMIALLGIAFYVGTYFIMKKNYNLE